MACAGGDIHFIDAYYRHVLPDRAERPDTPAGSTRNTFHVSWLDFVAPIGIGGIWLWYFFGQLMKRPLVPINDPYLDNAIHHGRGH